MYVQENKFICSTFSRMHCLVFFSHVLGIDQINDNNKFVANGKFIVLFNLSNTENVYSSLLSKNSIDNCKKLSLR